MFDLPEELREKLLTTASAVLAVVLFGVLGYVSIEGWPVFDALYMTVITLTTVGYGEVHPLTSAGRAFTIVLIFLGIGILTWGFSNLTAFIVEGELSHALRRRKMEKRIDALKGHYILCGAGHTGSVIIEELTQTRRPLVVIDRDPARIEKLERDGVLAVQGDATDDVILQMAGITRARGLFTALASDRDNAFVALTARGLNPDIRIVSEQIEHNVKEKLLRSGASAVVSPTSIGGLRMASEMIRPAVVGFLDHMLRAQGEAFRFEEVPVPPGSSLIGRPVQEVKGADGHAALVVSIRRPDGDYELNPPADRPVQAGETLVVMGTMTQLQDLKKKIAP